jgi:hypothetical protein
MIVLSKMWGKIGVVEVYFHSFLISALDGDEWLNSCHDHFTPQQRTPVSIEQEDRWAPETVWGKYIAPTGIGTPALQPAAQSLYRLR